MLKIHTTRFNEIEVSENDVIELPSGIIGFPELKKYVLLDHDTNSPFKWLQSLDDGAIAFVLLNPLLFNSEYTVEVNESEVGELSLENEEDAIISVIVTIPSNPKNMTANLKAPLVFNLKNRKGCQVILSNSKYQTRHNILEEVRKRENSKDHEAIDSLIAKVKDSSEGEAANIKNQKAT